ncbi:MAG: MBL fold metallo-hydrolase [Patescibacteria group bacterium]|nr:MBL fold metallo-hydrolase [Patescibacteria group bacterium]
MKLILLGTAGYHPSERRHTSCAILPEVGLMLDAGTGMFRAPRYLATDVLDIFLTHVHLDHVIGLTYLFNTLSQTQLKTVRVHGQAEKLRALEEHLFSEHLFPKRPPYEAVPLPDSGEVALSGGGRLTSFPLDHPGGAVGFRLDWPGHSMAYITDTWGEPDAAYAPRIQGVDLLVHECFFRDEQAEWSRMTGHTHATPVAELARHVQAKRLVLIHINPLAEGDDPIGLASARSIFPAMQVGEDGLEVEF